MNETDSMLDPTGSRRMRPAQTWWAGRSWRADRVGRNRERICRIAMRKGCNAEKNNKRRLPCLAVAHTMTTLQYVGSGLL
jgi:hypothetical protein